MRDAISALRLEQMGTMGPHEVAHDPRPTPVDGAVTIAVCTATSRRGSEAHQDREFRHDRLYRAHFFRSVGVGSGACSSRPHFTDALGLQLLNNAELDGQLTLEITWILPPAVAVREMISTFRDWKDRGEVDGVILI